MKKVIFSVVLVALIGLDLPVNAQESTDVLKAFKEYLVEQGEGTKEENTQELIVYKMYIEEFLGKASALNEVAKDYSTDIRCLYIMGKYIVEHKKLEDQINKESDCQKKYDLYSMLLMLVTSGTSFMYCSEEIYLKLNPSSEDYDPETVAALRKEFEEVLQGDSENNATFTKFKFILYWAFDPFNPAQVIKIIENNFHPMGLIAKLTAINTKMKDLEECAE